jgi:hypothetical protein
MMAGSPLLEAFVYPCQNQPLVFTVEIAYNNLALLGIRYQQKKKTV